MGVWKAAYNRVRYFGRRGFESELDQEIQFHIETRAAELEQAGVPAQTAAAQARREFGSQFRMREETRAAWQFQWLEDLTGDLRYAARAFRRNPAFVCTAVACLALGTGANTTIFSMATEALLSQPSVRDPATLVNFVIGGNSASPLKQYQVVRDQHLFSGIAGEDEESMANWRHGQITERLYVVRVTENYFQVTGIPVAIGRAIATGDRPSVVLSYGLWQRRMAGDPNVPGQMIVLDGKPYTIAGVLPRDHRTLLGFGFAPDLYMSISDLQERVSMYARLPAGVSRAALNARLPALTPLFQSQWPDHGGGWRGMHAVAVSGYERLQGDSQLMQLVAFAALLLLVVGLVLLIACANVASLLLARASSRSHEIAIRLAIGAGRGRLIRQLLAEGLLLALCGTGAGLAVNLAITSLLSRYPLPLPLPVQLQIRPDWRLLLYAIGLALVCTVAAGLMPAVRATSAGLRASRFPLRQTLVVGQLAVTIVLLCAGLIFLRNLVHASTMSPGFDTAHTVWASMRLVPQAYEHGSKTQVLIHSALDGLRALPGVDSAAIAERVPLNEPLTTGTMMSTDLGAAPKRVNFNDNYVGPDYFKTMVIPILRGREFTASDREGSPRVAILNENMARRLFGDIDPIGHSIRYEGNGPSIQIVGVATNSKYLTLGEQDPLAFYEPYAQQGEVRTDLRFLIHASGSPQLLVPAVNRVLHQLDDTAALDTKPMSQALGFALLPSRVGAAILGSVGLLGLTLAAIGLYGTMLYAVSRRTSEIGLRMALGATPGQVLRLVFRQSFVLAGTGIAIGTALAVFAVRPLSLFVTPEVRPADPMNFAIVAGILCAVALLATAAPAIRALRVDPLVALRHE